MHSSVEVPRTPLLPATTTTVPETQVLSMPCVPWGGTGGPGHCHDRVDCGAFRHGRKQQQWHRRREPKPDTRGRTSSVAFVLVGAGVAMLLLSLCLGMRNKQREQQALLEAQALGAGNVAASEEDGEMAEDRVQRYTVPSYEEVVGSGEYPIRQSNLRHSSSQLPSYDDLVDGVQIELEGSEVTQTTPASANPASSAAAAPNRRTGRTSLKLLPLKIRRIKSEKLFMDNSQPPGGISIEPLTPPPMYEDKAPEL